jgi:hypothetical protein
MPQFSSQLIITETPADNPVIREMINLRERNIY